MTGDKVFVVVQEGGSTGEAYVCTFDTEKEADAHRESCSTEGSYRTTPPIEVDVAIADAPGFCDAVAEIVRAYALDLDYPE